MTIKECIDIVDNIKPNQYTIKEKVMWLSFLDETIINDVLKTHEGYDGRYDLFEGYTEDKLSVKLIVPSPYDRLYTAYLKMRIDCENGETARYNNSQQVYDTFYMEYRKHYNKTHMPIDSTKRHKGEAPKKHTVGLSDAELENVKRDLYHLLSNDVEKIISPNKLYDIVTSYAQNNAEMFKGKPGKDGTNGIDGRGIKEIKQGYTSYEDDDFNVWVVTLTDGTNHPFNVKNGSKGSNGSDGYTPIKGIDYWTEADKEEVISILSDSVIGDIDAALDSILAIQEELMVDDGFLQGELASLGGEGQ